MRNDKLKRGVQGLYGTAPGQLQTGTGKTLGLHFPLVHHRGLRGGHTAKVEVSVMIKEGRLGASGILSDRPRLTLTSALVIGVLSSACAATAAPQKCSMAELPPFWPHLKRTPHIRFRAPKGRNSPFGLAPQAPLAHF